MDTSRFEKNWVKWEPILLYLFFAVRFNLATFFWIMPQFFVMVLTISEFNYIILLTLGLFPLLINLRMYVIVSPERRIIYRISKFLANLLFGSITYVMNLPYSQFSFSLIVILLITLIITMIVIDKIVSQKTLFAGSFTLTMKVQVIAYAILVALSFFIPIPLMTYGGIFFMLAVLLLMFMVYNITDALRRFIIFKN